MNKLKDSLSNANKYCHIYYDDVNIPCIHNTENNDTYRIIPDESMLGIFIERFNNGKLIARNSLNFDELKILTDLTGCNHLLQNLSGKGGEKQHV